MTSLRGSTLIAVLQAAFYGILPNDKVVSLFAAEYPFHSQRTDSLKNR